MTEDDLPEGYERFIDTAKRYAQLRWCWDDTSLIDEQLVLESVMGTDPFKIIDHLANHFELHDPFDPWTLPLAEVRERQELILTLKEIYRG